MTNIVLDTNIWIYLTKDTFNELWIKIKEMKETGVIKIIVNDIIQKEWYRNKTNTIETLTTSILSEYKSAINLSHYLEAEAKELYLKTILEYKNEPDRIQKATLKVEEIESFMNSCTIIQTTQAQKLFIAELAIEKKPPFHNNKNNFNDALIIRNICEATKSESPQLFDLIYVSNNPVDFIDKSTNQVYVDLIEGLKPIKFENVTQLGQALNLAPELIDDFEAWLDQELDNQAMYELDIRRGK
ncbi:MAG: PIN domain-containing protein [Bacteroidales bacterium]